MKFFKTLFLPVFLICLFSHCSKKSDSIQNILPVANAGVSKIITLPSNNVTFTGTGKDTDGVVVAYLWSQVSGPEQTIITNPGSVTATIRGFVQGTYVFQLMVTDNGGLTGVDTVSLIVNPSPALTLTLQPSNNINERVIANIGGVDESSTGTINWPIASWSKNGIPYNIRTAFQFDLSSIPSTATILTANLFLYSETPPMDGNYVDANFGTNNSMFLQQITSSWNPSTATWNNQPITTTINQVIIPLTTQSSLDLNIDVTTNIKSMINTNSNYGFCLRLQNEIMYESRIFVSSYQAAALTKHPKLVINYKL